VSGLRVTASFFSVLGVQPMLGRTFRREEEDAGRDRVVVLSHGLWTRRYRADPALVGNTIQIDGAAFTVVGVMPPRADRQLPPRAAGHACRSGVGVAPRLGV
jgi:putative ABC transport system permease protein